MPRRDRDIFAAEFVLGTLDAAEHAEAERLCMSDDTFAAAVEGWRARLAPLGETVPGIEAPAALQSRIEQAIAARTAPRQAGAIQSQIDAMRQSLAAWRMAAIGAAAAAAAIALMWMSGIEMPLGTAPPPARYVAVLHGDKGQAGFLVTMNMRDKQFVVHPVTGAPPPSKSYELWALMKDDDKPPMTLGLVGTGAYAMMDSPPEIDNRELEKGVRLAISLEPEGGAPKGQSMGRIMFAGDLVREAH